MSPTTEGPRRNQATTPQRSTTHVWDRCVCLELQTRRGGWEALLKYCCVDARVILEGDDRLRFMARGSVTL